jgi:hypothetical protein
VGGGRWLCLPMLVALYRNPIHVFPEMKLLGLVPNSYIHDVTVSIYIFPRWLTDT